MASIESVTLEVADPTAAYRFCTAAAALAGDAAIVSSEVTGQR
jgi:hypothetical protein